MFSGMLALQSFGREVVDWVLNSVPLAGWPVQGKLIGALPSGADGALLAGTAIATGVLPPDFNAGVGAVF